MRVLFFVDEKLIIPAQSTNMFRLWVDLKSFNAVPAHARRMPVFQTQFILFRECTLALYVPRHP